VAGIACLLPSLGYKCKTCLVVWEIFSSTTFIYESVLLYILDSLVGLGSLWFVFFWFW
jgi:hypothetical protein